MGVGEERVMGAHYIHTLKCQDEACYLVQLREGNLREGYKFQDLGTQSSWIPWVYLSSITLALGWSEAQRSQPHTERAM